MKYTEGLERHKDAKVKTGDARAQMEGEEVRESRKTTEFNAEAGDGVTWEQSQSVRNSVKYVNK